MFSRCYLAALGLQVLSSIMNWRSATPGAIQIGLILSLLLWYGVVYQRSNVARILVILCYVFGALARIVGFFLYPPSALEIASFIAPLILFTIAVGMLIEEKTSEWFKAKAVA